jgi:hypothetical protein
MQQWIVCIICGSLLAGVTAAQARTIESFAGSGGGSATSSSPGPSGFGFVGPNAFPPGNDPSGRIGRIDETDAVVSVRFEWLSGPAGAPAVMSFNSSTLAADGKLAISASSGVETRTTLIWDRPVVNAPSLGLGGQNLTDSPSGPACAPGSTADRLVVAVPNGDPNVQVEVSIEDTQGNVATSTRLGLPTGSVTFPYADFANAANVDFTSVDAMTVLLSGTNIHLTLEDITTACDPNDEDGDGVSDSQDVCLASDLRATVVFDTCNSGVRNPLLPSGCTLSDTLADCTGSRRPRLCIAIRTQLMESLDVLTDQQRLAINNCF